MMRPLLCLPIFAFVFSTSTAQTAANLSKFTIGFGAGYHVSLGQVQEYSLTTDSAHTLRIEDASRGAFVISSIITVRLGDVTTVEKSGGRLFSPVEIEAGEEYTARDLSDDNAPATPRQRWTINLAINLAEISAEGSAFNKAIDGGLGIGYAFTDLVQIGAFLDVQRVRQLRQYAAREYRGKSIPQATGIYTALDPADNNLFTMRTFAGVSVKLIFTLPNKAS